MRKKKRLIVILIMKDELRDKIGDCREILNNLHSVVEELTNSSYSE